MKEMKRIISLLLCLVMLVGYLPVNARAEEAMTTEPSVVETAEETAAETTEETEPEKPGKPAKFGKHEKNDKPGKPEKEGKSEQETTPVTETTVPVTEATVPATTEATVPETTGETEPSVIAVTGITLDQTALEVGVGELPMSLTATVQPEDATDKTVTWTSSEPGVASVDENGTLAFGYMGEAVITATAGDFSATCTVTVGEGEWDTYESDAIVVMAASDYQKKNSDPASTLSSILDQINDDYSAADGFLFGGDYYQDSLDSASNSKAGKNAVDAAVTKAFPDVPNRVYIQGNHDPASLITDGTLSATGEYDTDNYGVYAINEDDYPWGYGASDASFKATCQNTANALDAYLDEKAEEGYTQPIFVLTHVPLHYSPRTASSYGGDGKYAKYLYTVLDEAGDKGLNIIFLFGHNHSNTYDDYLGGGQIYLAEGSTIAIAEEGSTSQYFTDTLSFTYMNCGYIGYVGGNAGTNLSMSVFEITDEKVTVKRYGTGGEVELKAAGKTTSGAPTADTTVVASGEVIELNQFEPAAAITGITVTAPAKTAYVVGDALDTTGMVVTASYDDGSTKDVTGYEVSADLTSAGTKTVTVTYQEKTATFEITVYAPVKDETTGVTVAAPGVTGLTAAKVTEEVPEGTDYSAYVSYDITPEGYTSGAATVTVPVPASFDAGKPVMVLDGDSVLTTTTIVNGTVTFTATHFSVYAVAQASETALEWKEIPAGTIYTLVDTMTAGKEYLIVSTDSAGNAYALQNPGTTSNVAMGASSVEVLAGTAPTIKTESTDIVWTATQSGSVIKLINNGDYLEGKSGEVKIYNESQYSDRGWEYEGNQLKYVGGRNTYVVYYDSGFKYTYGSTSNKVYLYEKTGTGNGGYAAMTGTTVYNVVTDTTNAAALEAQIRSNLVVYTAADANGTNQTPTTEYTLSGTCDPAEEGTYTYTVTYGGVELGTVIVYVNDVTINDITVNPASGVVTVGASEAALVGATITVDVADGEDFTVPVTVGMLSGEFDTAVAGTYTNLTVTYGGQTDTGFTLTVREKVVNNYPSYPNEGAVKVDKKAHGVDFQKTGVAQVELTTSGVPMNQGVDVVLILDTSSSMDTKLSMLNNRTRIDVLKECVDALIVNLKAPRPDGSESDIDIAIADFAGYLLGHDGTKLNNYIGSQVKETDADEVGAVLTNGWVDVQSLPDNWGTANIKAKSGTNYDHGLEMAYNLLAQKQADNGDKTRKQFVMFLSDGAPLQYNGVNSNSLGDDWEQWILGSYSTADVNKIGTIKNKDFYYGNNGGNGQKHWVAEAIKGSPDQEYSIVYHENYTYGAATMGTKAVSGLGATIYSVGLALEKTNMPTDAVGQAAILSTLASSPELSTAVTTPNGLQDFFDDFAGAVLYAADNAVFEDQMGPNFNIQLASTTIRKVDNVAFVLDPAPTIEVREYTIWTRSELENANGTLSEENAKKVGTRKTDAEGNYIYNTLEVVRFNAEGTKAYSNKINIDNDNVVGWSTGTDGKITLDEGDNILNEGIISAKTFWYNNGTTTVKVDVDGNGTAETDLAPETFIWKVGTIKTTELALSYYVYLDESLEGDASAGSYDTNTYAILTYDNYLGNPCQKETISPQLAWLSANVSYAYYLVNRNGVPVNANGEEVTFANREIIVHPTKYGEIKLNSIEDIESLRVASTGVLDEGNYALFDYDAEYLLSVNSDATGGWTIKVGNGKPATTYVTGFSSTQPFTNATSSDSDTDNYDYTHTTVWFAVVWEPRTVADTVVVDYGLPVDVHVLTNDFFGDFGELIGVANDAVTDRDGNIRTNEIPASTDPVAGNYGSALVRKPDTGANESNSVIRYELNSMEMKEPEVFTYSVEYTNTKLQTNNGFYYGTLTVIPATTIYYEDEFVTLTSETKGTDGNWTNDTPAAWTPVGTEVDATQAEDRPGDINFAFNTVIDANNVYGYDSAYSSMSQYSLGSAAKANVYSGHRAKATFEFYGTGFDVISLTSNKTGTIVVSAYPWDAAKNAYSADAAQSYIVDTYYGYTRNDEGEWVVVTSNEDNSLYQVPVMKISGLPYGKYKAVIVAAYDAMFDHEQYDGTNYDFYLDAIRIYDPANNGAGNQVIENAYKADGEGWPTYYEVRNMIIEQATVDQLGKEAADGIVFIDGVRENASVSDYKSYGPNNETYLAAGQAIAFELSDTGVEKIQLAVKTVGGSASVKVYSTDGVTALDQEINTATDMYYDITAMNGKTVVIMNDGESGILSITNVKITHTAAPTTGAKFLLRRSSVDAALATMNVEEDTVPGTSEPVVPEESVPESSEPEEMEPAEPDNSELKEAVKAAKKLKAKDYTKESFKALETARKAAERILKDSDATQAQIDEALADLNAALEALEAKPDNSELKAAVNAAKKLKEKDYTKESFKNLKTAIKAAEKVLKDKKATQTQIDKALADLNAALEALEAKPDNSELKAAVNAAKKLKEKDYTKESFKNLKTAIKAAEKVLKDKKATQTQIDKALEELSEAVEALEAAASKGKPGKKKR